MFAFVSKNQHSDPAWRGRVTGLFLASILLWYLLVASEFKPWTLFDVRSLNASARFLSGFVPPAHSPEFLIMLLQSTWQTVAMATAGLTLALLGAIPFTLIVTRRLSISSVGTGRMSRFAGFVRQVVRWLLVLLRSVPELVWALLLARWRNCRATAAAWWCSRARWPDRHRARWT